MLIRGYQSIVEVTTGESASAEGPDALVELTVRVESHGFTATRMVRVEPREVRAFVSQLKEVERVRPARATLKAMPEEELELRIGFAEPDGQALIAGRLAVAGAGYGPALEFAFEFDPATLPAIVAEAERWIAPPRHEAATVFERQFLAWLHIRFGVLPTPRHGTNAQWWTFEHDGVAVSFVVVGQAKNGACPPSAGIDWLLRIEEPEPCAFIEWVRGHFTPESSVRRRMSTGQIRVQFKSTALVQPFLDQTEGTW